MPKFINKETKATLEPKSEFVAEQLRKDKRYKEVGGTKELDGAGGGQKEKPIEKMSKPELLELAAQKGVDVDESMTNKELVEALKAAAE